MGYLIERHPFTGCDCDIQGPRMRWEYPYIDSSRAVHDATGMWRATW